MIKSGGSFLNKLKIKDIIDLNNKVKYQEFEFNNIIESNKNLSNFKEIKDLKNSNFQEIKDFDIKQILEENNDLLKQIREKIEIKKEIDEIREENISLILKIIIGIPIIYFGYNFINVLYEDF